MAANNNDAVASHVEPDRSHPFMISVQVDPQFAAGVNLERLHDLACYTLEAEGHHEPVQLGVTITGDAQIHELNVQYLGHDYPTDVLSFGAEGAPVAGGRTVGVMPADDEDEDEAGEDDEPAAQFNFVTPPDWPLYLGDIVISYETAAAQAPDYDHSAAAEVDYLLVHGVLHLLGYDDLEPAARERMHARQEELVGGFAARS